MYTLFHKSSDTAEGLVTCHPSKLLTNLLIDDDDSGDSLRVALNQIERFRIMIKNKYRNFLTKEEIETMSKQLVLLQKEAKKRLMDIQENYEILNNTRGR